MNIVNISITAEGVINISINAIATIITVLIILGVIGLVRWILLKNRDINHLYINEIELGIGSNSKVRLGYDDKDKQIAYQLWVEISTRKIGITFEEGKDVIEEVYNSWYDFFKITRELIKDIPVRSINTDGYDGGIIDVSIKVLNNGIRPDLTEWQAKFRKWYQTEYCNEVNKFLTPQQIQEKYPDYKDIIIDIKTVNSRMIEYKKLLYKISFGKEE